MSRLFMLGLAILWCARVAVGAATETAGGAGPSIVYILCDDLGYGDVHALNPSRGRIATPALDRLAGQGMIFSDAHSGSSVCSPTRYGILTGRYSWRTRLQSGVLMGFDKPLIALGRLTVPQLLKQHGYATACLGKWHLGLTFDRNSYGPISDGPLQHGFDSFFGISASLDMPPFAFIEDDHFPQKPTVTKKWMRAGPAAVDFEAADVLPRVTERAVSYVASRAAAAREGHPFFLYVALPSPHTALVPAPAWRGKSPLGEYGDYVMQTDDAIGQVVKAIDDAGLDSQTLLIVTSDNGFAPYVGAARLEAMGHYPSADFRGYKFDIWEGGHRIPFLARWTGKIAPGSKCQTTICLTDLMATVADLVGQKLPPDAGEDSVSALPMLLGHTDAAAHEAVVHHSGNGMFAIRKGRWKLELCPGSGGASTPTDAKARKEGLPPVQLYDMQTGANEQSNVESANRPVVASLLKLLKQYIRDGRSTPGPAQKNDVDIDLWKAPDPHVGQGGD